MDRIHVKKRNKRKGRWLRRLMWVIGVILFLVAAMLVFIRLHPDFGGRPNAEELKRMRSSPQFRDNRFVNAEPTPMVFGQKGSFWKLMGKFLRGVENSRPEKVETVAFNRETFMQAPGDPVITWFGHSTVLLRLSGKVFLFDPVFSRRASPVGFAGTKAFKYTHTHHVSQLPPIDGVVISHDHYDHLDRATILKLAASHTRFYVPLGVEAHLRRWGIDGDRIFVADWWREFSFPGGLKLAAVPARHFSGRTPFNRNATLWCGWVIMSGEKRVFFSGDSGYGAHFKEIGRRFGPFDLNMLECGQYNPAWAWVHSFPEQTVQAHLDLGSGYLLPLHWGKFRISTHTWMDPAVRVMREAERLGVDVVIPRIGAVVAIPPPPRTNDWAKILEASGNQGRPVARP